jgi:hypothetical protein
MVDGAMLPPLILAVILLLLLLLTLLWDTADGTDGIFSSNATGQLIVALSEQLLM